MRVPTDKTPCRDERGRAFVLAKDGVLRGASKCCNFASDFRKNGHFPRADRVVRPYGAKWKINTDLPEGRHKIGAFGGSMWASTPTARNGKRGDFCRTRVIFNTLCRGGRLCPPYKIVQFCAVVCRGRCPHRPIKILRIRIGFPQKRAFSAGGQSRPPLRCEIENQHGFAGRPP